MIRTTAARPLRVSAAAASVAGLALLAGCASQGGTGDAPSAGDAPAGDATGPYADGEYTAEGSYQTPESVETISVTLTLADDVVTAVEVTGDPTRAESEQYQGQFIGGISDEVVGKKLDEISVDRVAGSSLTSGGFTQALDKIRADAAE
ncbi:hypothetical protein AB3M83_06655 [Microbacterium sp. 179-B 1A2 NHS]|uniref:FMN-binding protein n=1 Tax=Microbacterium sp. 179-B 1A2 NHS TaxID=3142383 RepID=UPI0039A1E0B0